MDGGRASRGAWKVAACVLAVSATVGVPSIAQAAKVQLAKATRGDRLAYETTMKCFVANGIVVGDGREAGDKAKVAKYDALARQSFDMAVQLGRKIGLTGQHINQDFGLAQSRELPRMVADPAYFKSAAATCRALGLM